MSRLSNLSRSIEGSVAIVTGAASGMGAATAKLFAEQGARVAALDLNEAPLTAVVEDASGAVIPGATVGWVSADEAVATVSAAGLVTSGTVRSR